jgi:hypothetical protein
MEMGSSWEMFENMLKGLNNNGEKLGENIFQKFVSLFQNINDPQSF